jgi:hypothetical protein
MEKLVEWKKLVRETEVLRENLRQCHCVYYRFHNTWHGFERRRLRIILILISCPDVEIQSNLKVKSEDPKWWNQLDTCALMGNNAVRPWRSHVMLVLRAGNYNTLGEISSAMQWKICDEQRHTDRGHVKCNGSASSRTIPLFILWLFCRSSFDLSNMCTYFWIFVLKQNIRAWTGNKLWGCGLHWTDSE